jgi:septum formation protein
MTLWRAAAPLLLASASTARRVMLEAAGIPVEVKPADVDERSLQRDSASRAGEKVALLLAKAKARSVSMAEPRRVVVGADQTLSCDDRLFNKPANTLAAFDQLMSLRGRAHELHSAVAVMRDNVLLFSHCDTARLTMRPFSEAFLRAYIDTLGAAATQSVGGYQIESLGAQLFERIDGDHFTILGLPLLPLLGFLREHGLLHD